MAENGSYSIFDEAGRAASKKKASSLKKSKEAASAATPPAGKVTEQELQNLSAKSKKLQEELLDKLGQVQKMNGMDESAMKAYLKNPKNFRSEEWNVIQKRKADLQDQLISLLGEDAGKKIKKEIMDKKARERKNKIMGTRKKWIPIK